MSKKDKTTDSSIESALFPLATSVTSTVVDVRSDDEISGTKLILRDMHALKDKFLADESGKIMPANEFLKKLLVILSKEQAKYLSKEDVPYPSLFIDFVMHKKDIVELIFITQSLPEPILEKAHTYLSKNFGYNFMGLKGTLYQITFIAINYKKFRTRRTLSALSTFRAACLIFYITLMKLNWY